MGTVVSKTTFEVIRSINTPDFALSDWVVNPEALDSLIGTGSDSSPEIAKRYWVVDPPESQNLREMTPSEKDGADAEPTLLAAARVVQFQRLSEQTDGFVQSIYSTAEQLSLSNLVRAASGEQRIFLLSFYAWYESVYTALSGAFELVGAAASVPAIEAISLDYGPFAISNPGVTVEGVLALAPGVVTGDGMSVYDDKVSTTTSTTFQTKVQIQDTTLAAGTYRIHVSYGWNVDSTASDIEVRLQERSNGGSFADVGQLHKQEPSESGGAFGFTGSDQRFYVTRIFERVLGLGTYSWRLQYRSETTVAASLWETLLHVEAV